jgi:hypothetical protein
MNDIQSVQKKYWIERNSIKTNEGYIEKLLKHYKIERYNFTINDLDEDLTISMGKRYLVRVNTDEMYYALLEENLASNPQKKEKYHLVRKFTGDTDVMYDVLKFISEKEIKSNGSNCKRILAI